MHLQFEQTNFKNAGFLNKHQTENAIKLCRSKRTSFKNPSRNSIRINLCNSLKRMLYCYCIKKNKLLFLELNRGSRHRRYIKIGATSAIHCKLNTTSQNRRDVKIYVRSVIHWEKNRANQHR